MTTKGKRSLARRAAPWAASAAIFVAGWEGIQTVAYADKLAGNIPTVCAGETRGVKLGDRYTIDECRAMLANALHDYADGARRCVDFDGMPVSRQIAVVSVTYNIGVGAFCKSSMARKFNSGDVQGACDAFLLWDKAGGIRWRGLTNRRKAERELCLR
jgi:lysozyme